MKAVSKSPKIVGRVVETETWPTDFLIKIEQELSGKYDIICFQPIDLPLAQFFNTQPNLVNDDKLKRLLLEDIWARFNFVIKKDVNKTKTTDSIVKLIRIDLKESLLALVSYWTSLSKF